MSWSSVTSTTPKAVSERSKVNALSQTRKASVMKRIPLFCSLLAASTLITSVLFPSLHRPLAQAQEAIPIMNTIDSEEIDAEGISSKEIDSEERGSKETSDQDIDAFIANLMAEKQIPGLSLAVVRDGKLIKTQAYGQINRSLNVRARPSSIFPIASVSKPFTATAVMLLVQDGLINLDEPISRYLADTPTHWQTITVRHLLTHTSGLSKAVYDKNIRDLTTLKGFFNAAKDNPLMFEPGESWTYSNTNYNLAALLIETVSEQPFGAFMKNRIFEPLGMTNTDAIRASYQFNNFATGYFSDNHNNLQPHALARFFKPKFVPIFYGSGSITSTATDLARWDIAMQKGELLTAESQEAMAQPVVMNSDRTFQYGLGWFVEHQQGHSIISHGGNLGGFSTSISRFPKDKLTIVVLTNKDAEDGDAIARSIAEQYIPQLAIDINAPKQRDPNPTLTEQLRQLANGETSEITFTPEWETMLTTPRGQRGWQAYQEEMPSIQTLELIQQEPHTNGTRYYYRAVTTNENRLLTFVITPDNQIAALGTASH